MTDSRGFNRIILKSYILWIFDASKMNKLEEKPSENGSGRACAEKKKTTNGIGKYSRAPFVIKAKFEGDCDDLKGHIYDCNDSKKAD